MQDKLEPKVASWTGHLASGPSVASQYSHCWPLCWGRDGLCPVGPMRLSFSYSQASATALKLFHHGLLVFYFFTFC